MTLLSFKDVGVKTYDTDRTNTTVESDVPIGIKTPLEFGDGSSGLLKMHYDVGEQLTDNLKNLLLTNHGERLSLYRFGANLLPLVVEYTSKEDFDAEAMLRINTAVRQWMPFVQLDGYDSKAIHDNNSYIGKVEVTVEFSIPRVQLFNKRIVLILYVT
jgi:phage baseplate assembly protein W